MCLEHLAIIWNWNRNALGSGGGISEWVLSDIWGLARGLLIWRAQAHASHWVSIGKKKSRCLFSLQKWVTVTFIQCIRNRGLSRMEHCLTFMLVALSVLCLRVLTDDVPLTGTEGYTYFLWDYMCTERNWLMIWKPQALIKRDFLRQQIPSPLTRHTNMNKSYSGDTWPSHWYFELDDAAITPRQHLWWVPVKTQFYGFLLALFRQVVTSAYPGILITLILFIYIEMW